VTRRPLLLGYFTLGLLLAALIADAPTSFAQSDEDLEAQINGTPAGASLELEARDYYVDGTIDVGTMLAIEPVAYAGQRTGSDRAWEDDRPRGR
jgi:hypothetical protein